ELLRMRRRRGAQEVLRLSGGRRAQSAGVGGRRPPARGDARRGREGARPGSRGARWGSWQGAGFWRRQPAARMGARARRGRQRAGQARKGEGEGGGRRRIGRNKERRYRDKGSESVTKNPYRSLLVLRRCVLKQHCLARERHPERSLPAPMEHCHFASGARQLWRGAPTRNETRIERGRRRRRVMKRRSSKRRDRRRQAHTFGRRKRRVSRETTWRPCAAAYAGRPSGTLHWKRGHLSEPLRGEDDPDFFRGSLKGLQWMWRGGRA
ncbi:unnamed protein product, partial [Prorocentrum cordatum]